MSAPKPPSMHWEMLTRRLALRARWRAFGDRYARQPARAQELLPVPPVMAPGAAPATAGVPVAGA